MVLCIHIFLNILIDILNILIDIFKYNFHLYVYIPKDIPDKNGYIIQSYPVNKKPERKYWKRFAWLITPMTSYLFINKVWPAFAELLATRPMTIHEFHSTGIH